MTYALEGMRYWFEDRKIKLVNLQPQFEVQHERERYELITATLAEQKGAFVSPPIFWSPLCR